MRAALLGLVSQAGPDPEVWSETGGASDLWALGGMILGWAIVGLFAYAFLRAIAHRRRYLAVCQIGDAERAELQAVVEEAEQSTRGEIFVVCLERSDRHPAAEWIAAVVVSLVATSLFAAWLPWEHPMLLIGVQVLFGVLGFCAARLLPDFKRRFVSPDRATEMAEEQSIQEFFQHGVFRTEDRIGVLIFISLFEHRVIVLGDEGISKVVSSESWTEVDDAVLAGVRSGSLKQGVAEGIRRCGAVLSEHFPLGDEDRDELPNHVIVRRE